MPTRMIRHVTDVESTKHDVLLHLGALPAVQLGMMPGWITGEPLLDQGVETQMPNLPNIDLPPTDAVSFALRVSAPQPGTLRLTLAPQGAGMLDDDGTALGIVVDPAPDRTPVTVEESPETVSVLTDALRLDVGRAPFTLTLTDRASSSVVLRTSDRLRQVAGFLTAPAALRSTLAPLAGVSGSPGTLTINLELAHDEDVLGFGEQFGRLVKNGQLLRLRSEDACGTGTGLAYKPVPVWHSSRGYTGFVNTGAIVTADVGHNRPSVLGLTVDDEGLDVYLFVGPEPAQRLSAYTALTGRASVPPPWAFGYWMGRCRYHTAEQMLEVADAMRNENVPLDVLHIDPDWLVVDRLNTDFIWNTERFGNRRQFVGDLAERGVRLSMWELPYIDPVSPIFEEAEREGYLVRGTDGSLAGIVKTPTPDGRMRALVDFTNPQARRWWQEMHRAFLDDGVAVFKTDFGEALPDDAALFDGTPAHQAHNLYPLRYNQAVYEAVDEFTDGPLLVWGRSGWAGSQRYPGQWAGDAESTVAGMQATVRGGLSYALSAPGFWSHDIGGFFGPELTPELYVRWTQLGALSPLMRAHGLRPREPYAFGERALTISRDWIRLRYSLLPYLWQVAHESAANGWPVMRPLGFHFPHDPVAASIDDSFMLGADLLVVPVFDDTPGPVTRRFYVPEGRWVDLTDGTTYAGPGHHEVEVPLERMPVLVREGAVVPTVAVDDDTENVESLYGVPWQLTVFGGGDTETGVPTEPLELVGFDGSITTVTIRDGVASAEGTQSVAGEVARSAG